MDRTLLIVIILVAIFTSFLIGYSMPPYIQAGVFSGRKEKGVESQIDKNMEQYYKNLLKNSDK